AWAGIRRCLGIACRATAEPAGRRVIDCGPLAPSRSTSASRVSSPSAAKSGAASAGSVDPVLGRDIARDVRELLSPALIVHTEGGGTTLRWNTIEARLHHRELRAVGDIGEVELDEGGRLVCIVHARLDGVRMPAV